MAGRPVNLAVARDHGRTVVANEAREAHDVAAAMLEEKARARGAATRRAPPPEPPRDAPLVLEPLDGFEDVLKTLKATVAAPASRAASGKIHSPVKFAAEPSPRQEMAYRELCRRKLAWFTARATPGYDCGWVHWHLARRLERFREQVRRREAPRLMVFFPPRHGKTRKVSICFPAQTLGQHPDWDLILTSYSSDLAERNSRAVRELINAAEYGALYPGVAVAHHARAVNEWETNHGGHVRAAGVGGSILGMGAHVLVVDDPIKNAEEADSDLARGALWAWYGAVATTRLAPGAGVVLIQQRWRWDDLSGQLLSGQREAEERHATELDDAKQRYARQLRAASLGATESSDGAATRREPSLQPRREPSGAATRGAATRGAATRLVDFEQLVAASSQLRDARDSLLALDKWEVFKYPALADEDEYLDHGDRIVRAGELTDFAGRVLDPSPLPDPPPEGDLRLLRRKGDALHAQRYDRVKLLRHKIAPATQPRHWSAMYQQNPRVEEGAYFDSSLLKWRAPLSDRELGEAWIALTGDMAISKRKSAKRTSFSVLARLAGQPYVILEWSAGRWGTTELLDEMERLIRRWKPHRVGLEQEKITLTFMPVLLKHLQEKGLKARFDDTLVPIEDKEARARPMQGVLEKGLLRVVGSPDTRHARELVAALDQFPLGFGVDVVDSLAWAVRLSDKNAGKLRPSLRTRPVSSVAEAIEEHMARRTGQSAGGFMAA